MVNEPVDVVLARIAARRAAKVAGIVEWVNQFAPPVSKAANRRAAQFLAGLGQADRDLIARKAGVNVPSDLSWAAVVAAVINRPVSKKARRRGDG